MHLARLFSACGLVLSGTVALASAAGAVEMLANGGFESGPPIPPSQATMSVAPGNAAITGWTVTGGAITIVTDGYWQPQSGSRSVALSSSGPGSIQQVVVTSAGVPYRLTFWLSGEPFTTPTVKHLRVQAGAVSQDYAVDITEAWHWDMHWQACTFDFTAAGPATMVSFTSLDAGAWGPAIETAGVEAVTAGVGSTEDGLALAPVAPDPVLGAGRVAFRLPAPQRVPLSVIDLQGREVAVLVDGPLGAGPHGVTLSARSIGLRSGLYFLAPNAGGHTVVRRFTTLQ
ncbi:MAG: choice-of-anchor C family protein [Candidatus Eiseniibacteriota bacterium]